MVFSSYRFIFAYLPITLLGYHLLRKTGRAAWVKGWLVAASLVFYGVGQSDFLWGFTATIAVNYLILLGLRLRAGKWTRRGLLLGAVVWNLGLLVYFKYTNFLLKNINWALGTDLPYLQVILPIGISFFTFQILAFTVSYYRGECDFPSLLDYGVFVTFFPQLIVGPVVRHEEVMPQIQRDKLLSYDTVFLRRGIMLFSVGCAKKILLADPLIRYASAFYGGDVARFSLVETWMAVLAYVFAYYFDFSGYIDMARGLGCFFGVSLPINFDSPYKARDFGDFWRRWNITISRFFNETVFSSLFHFGDGIGKLILATVCTFLVSGLWHGAAWHYIAWGLVNGLLVCVANLRTLRDRKPLPKALAVFLTFFIGALTRVLFDCTGLTQARLIYGQLFRFGTLAQAGGLVPALVGFVRSQPMVTAVFLLSAGICFLAPNSNRIMEKEDFTGREAVFSAVLLALSLFNMTQVSTFLYFNF